MDTQAPITLWFRRDFRLNDHPALAEAARSGRPVIAVFVLDEVAETYGAAPKWRLAAALDAFADRLERLGSRLIFRRGRALAQETGARDIWWSRAYEPDAIARDTGVKAGLIEAGLGAKSFLGQVLFEPWTVTTKQSSHFKVYSPMWRAVKNTDVSAPEPTPDQLCPPETWPQSDRLADWGLGAAMNRGAAVLAEHACIGEDRAGAARGFSGWPRGAVQGMPGFPGRRRYVAAVGKPRLGRDRAAHGLACGAQGVR